MHFSGLTLGVSLIVSLILSVSHTGGQNNKSKAKSVRVPCTRSINVDPGNGADPETASVCTGDVVKWVGQGHKFKVTFKEKCPFEDCTAPIDDQHPNSSKVKEILDLTVFKYTINVDGKKDFDPFIVGGGGPIPPPNDPAPSEMTQSPTETGLPHQRLFCNPVTSSRK